MKRHFFEHVDLPEVAALIKYFQLDTDAGKMSLRQGGAGRAGRRTHPRHAVLAVRYLIVDNLPLDTVRKAGFKSVMSAGLFGVTESCLVLSSYLQNSRKVKFTIHLTGGVSDAS